METKELLAALDLLNNPQRLRVQLEKDLSIKADNLMAEMPVEAISAELLRGIAESLDTIKPEYKAIRQQLVKKHSATHRDVTQVLDLAGKAYELVKDHWAEIYFMINILNKKGYLNKLKNNPKLKDFFKTLLEEK